MLLGYLLAICTVISCLGYGLGLGRLVGIAGNIGDAGILGLLSLAILGCGIHFFSALTLTVQVAVLGVGMALTAIFHREMIGLYKENPLAIFVGLSAFFHRQAFTFYDTGLYHLQTFLWNTRFPITLGLGNLHGRLAFNSSLFLIAPLDDRAGIGWVTNLAVLAFVLMSCYARLSQVTGRGVEFWFLTIAIFVLALFPETLYWVGVFNADGFAAVLIIYWFSILISFPSNAQENAGLLFLTAALALTVKVSAAPLLILAIVILWMYRKDVRPFRALAVAGVWLGLWMTRGLLLSGCALYPLPQSCIVKLPWAVSTAQAAYELLGIKSWARTPHRIDYDHVMGNWAWTAPWAVRSLEDWNARLLLAGTVAGVLCVLFGARVSRLVMAAAGGLAIGLTYWFFSAPDVRFGSGYLAAAGILGLAIVCDAYFRHFRGTNFAHRLTLEAIAASMLIGAAGVVKYGNTWTVQNRPAFVTMAAPGGKQIWVPREVDQCWDQQPPCTPYFNPDALQRVRWR